MIGIYDDLAPTMPLEKGNGNRVVPIPSWLADALDTTDALWRMPQAISDDLDLDLP